MRTLVLIMVLVCGLTGCGGGDWEEDERKELQPVDCKAQPEKCR